MLHKKPICKINYKNIKNILTSTISPFHLKSHKLWDFNLACQQAQMQFSQFF